MFGAGPTSGRVVCETVGIEAKDVRLITVLDQRLLHLWFEGIVTPVSES